MAPDLPDFLEIDHVALRVSDLARSVAWYEDVLGFERLPSPWGDSPVMLRNGGAELALFPAPAGARWPSRAERVIRHVAFAVGREAFEAMRRHLTNRGSAPRFEDHALCHSLYVTDPDGHELEVLTHEV